MNQIRNEYIRIPKEQVITARKWIITEDGKLLKEVKFVAIPHKPHGESSYTNEETFYTYVEPDYELENGDVLVLI